MIINLGRHRRHDERDTARVAKEITDIRVTVINQAATLRAKARALDLAATDLVQQNDAALRGTPGRAGNP